MSVNRPMNEHRQAGFTLLEVVIAIALTALIGVAVAGLVNGLVSTEERFATPPDERQDMRFARRLEDRLQALVSRSLHEGGQPLLNHRLDYRPEPGVLEWVALVGEPVALGDRVSRLRRQRLSWDLERGELQLASAGLLDALNTPQWQREARLTGIETVEIAFHEHGQWRQTPTTANARTVRGLRLRWQRHGREHDVIVRLPEVQP
ncbi:type II secretion system protein J (GspJ) [Halomonas caseinilytica]|uniref:Type II secretion system protein J (GspJ) n=2 Tax=Halomonas caseinilytica TaxID=438744 RepID=A0A1M6MR59_9GAMM|nr:type II secretion system protein J (GspJ) [Halomonas caseinilytica]SHJ85951.1 type II secretion system protein J (GspJ) [Halomonas caseinilytica]